MHFTLFCFAKKMWNQFLTRNTPLSCNIGLIWRKQGYTLHWKHPPPPPFQTFFFSSNLGNIVVFFSVNLKNYWVWKGGKTSKSLKINNSKYIYPCLKINNIYTPVWKLTVELSWPWPAQQSSIFLRVPLL